MSSLGRTRTRWAAVGAAVAVTIGAAGLGGLNIVNADVSSGDRPVFISINPCRLVDTRPGGLTVGPRSSPIGTAETVAVAAHGSQGECTGASAIPTDALGLSLNVTAIAPTQNTFLTFWGDGDNPGTSNLNPRAGGAPTPNSVSTPLSSVGAFSVFNNRGDVDVVIDVNGYYAPHDHDDRYYTEDESDDRYVEKPTDVLIDGRQLQSEFGSGWVFDVAWTHTAGPDDCVDSNVDLPLGATVTGAEMYYGADAPADVTVAVFGQPSSPGSIISDDLQLFALFDSDVPVVPDGDVGVQDVPVDPGGALVTAGYSHTLRVCTDDDLSLGGVRITFTNPEM